MRTRLYSQPLDVHGAGQIYSGAIDAAQKMASTEGPAAFYKGVTGKYRAWSWARARLVPPAETWRMST